MTKNAEHQRARARLTRAKPNPIPTFCILQSAICILSCPVCRKPFQNDADVGPVPACECSDRGKVEEEAPRDPADETEGEVRPPLHFEIPEDTDEDD